jgi:hypothetical protein
MNRNYEALRACRLLVRAFSRVQLEEHGGPDDAALGEALEAARIAVGPGDRKGQNRKNDSHAP